MIGKKGALGGIALGWAENTPPKKCSCALRRAKSATRTGSPSTSGTTRGHQYHPTDEGQEHYRKIGHELEGGSLVSFGRLVASYATARLRGGRRGTACTVI